MKDILDKGRKYKYTSLEYIDAQDLLGAEIFKETENNIFIYKVSKDKIQLYWASKSKENFIGGLKDFLIYANGKKVYIEFIPKFFIGEMEELGFKITSEFVDYWQKDLNKIETQQQIHSILIREIRDTEYFKASNITKSCKSQSRGFNGETEESIKQWCQSKNSKIFIAEKDGKQIGVSMVNLYGFDSEKGIVLWIRLLAVNPVYQRQGVGRALLNYSINWGKTKGAKRSFLASDVQNDNAIQLYKDFGYEAIEGRGQINMENQKRRKSKLENLTITNKINSLIEKNNFSGVISIKKQGNIIYENAVGHAERSNKVNNNRETKFGIASGTKFFTALGIGKLIEEGKISFETKVFDIIKYDFKFYSKDITIKQLLTHTSGIPDYFDEEKIDDFDNFFVAIPWYDLKAPKDYFPIFPKEKMKFLPGERFSYCNSGYVLLAAIINEVSGMPYKDFVEEFIFKAIGMNNSGFFALNRLPENTAMGYVKDNNGWRTNIFNLPIVGGGDGGAFTTVGDLYILWDALLNYKIISKDLVELFIKPYIKAESEGENLYYGHGIWVHKEKGKPIEEYIIGCDAGISFKSAIVREKDIIYTVISNTGDGAWPIIRKIMEEWNYEFK